MNPPAAAFINGLVVTALQGKIRLSWSGISHSRREILQGEQFSEALDESS